MTTMDNDAMISSAHSSSSSAPLSSYPSSMTANATTKPTASTARNSGSSPLRKLQLYQIIVSILLFLQVILYGVLLNSNNEQIEQTSTIIANGLQHFMNTSVPSKSVQEGDIETNQQQLSKQHVLRPSSVSIPSSALSKSSSSKNNKNLWDDSKILPTWMKDYFAWHKEELQKVTPETWKDHKYLVMRCLNTDARCGGTADRIKTVPLLIHWAAKTNRLLMIHWSRPAALEEFLMPPEGGMDWRVPAWLAEDVIHGGFVASVDGFDRKLKPQDISARTKLQSYNGGSIYYDANVEGPKFEEIYHDVWRTLFTPSLPVQKLIADQMERFHLRPGHYTAAHLRGLYAVKERAADALEDMARNALNCASTLRPDGPIYFATDSKVAVDYVVSSYAVKKQPTQIVALQRDYEPLHLEKALNWENRTASEYYDTFVDLYLIGLSRCVSYNVGGFGQWGLWISSDVNCSKLHADRRKKVPCEWSGVATPSAELADNDEPLFVPPMGSHHEVAAEAKQTEDDLESDEEEIEVPEALWEKSSTIPSWMKNYFEWHRETRANITQDNWDQTKYFVMQCLRDDERCGGLSDRLRPMPTMILLAARSKRLLLIQWSRPFPLEEFLVPPVGGINWTVPTWLAPRIEKKGDKKGNLKGLLPSSMNDGVVLRARYQSGNHGAEYFNNETDAAPFEELYHDMFRVLFEPAPPVAKLIETNMMTLGLRPGEYVAAHFRALYGRDYRHPNETAKVAINAVNCASELRPGGPVFFAADHKVAIDFVKEYAAKGNLPVVSLDHEDEPLHLDKDTNWTDRHPSAYYATFVDLYLLGQSRCMAYSNGGFGTFGLLLSYDASCSVRYFSKKIIKDCPAWVKA